MDLLQRRAYMTVDGIRKPLTDNITIEKLLGEKNILCLTDLSHEIYSLGENLDSALKILTAFNLTTPLGQFEKKILKNHDSVETRGGYLGDAMDSFLQKIL